MLSLLATLQVVSKDVQLWPTSVAGWVTLFVAILGVLSTLYAYAKTLVHINGLGARVDEMEKNQKLVEGTNTMVIRSVERITTAHEEMMSKVGEARTDANTCRESMELYVRELAAKFDELRREINTEGRLVGERLKGVEIELSLTRKGRMD